MKKIRFVLLFLGVLITSLSLYGRAQSGASSENAPASTVAENTLSPGIALETMLPSVTKSKEMAQLRQASSFTGTGDIKFQTAYQTCPASCARGWHSCPTANGQCGCFLDAQGPCPK